MSNLNVFTWARQTFWQTYRSLTEAGTLTATCYLALRMATTTTPYIVLVFRSSFVGLLRPSGSFPVSSRVTILDLESVVHAL